MKVQIDGKLYSDCQTLVALDGSMSIGFPEDTDVNEIRELLDKEVAITVYDGEKEIAEYYNKKICKIEIVGNMITAYLKVSFISDDTVENLQQGINGNSVSIEDLNDAVIELANIVGGE